MNNQIAFSGLKSYQIDRVYDPLLQVKLDKETNSKARRNSMVGKKNPDGFRRIRVMSMQHSDPSDFKLNSSNHSHKSTMSSSSAQGSGERKNENLDPAHTNVMQERWTRSNQLLPAVDKDDIAQEHPRFNNGAKATPERQHHPEFS